MPHELPDADALGQALAGARRSAPAAGPLPDLIVVGAVGALGNAVLEQLIGQGGHATVHVAVDAGQSMAMALRGVQPVALEAALDLATAPRVAADRAVLVFDQPRSRRGREDALFVPGVDQLGALAAWLRACGVASLVIVLPHAPMSLPGALKAGLASVDEHAVAALGWRHAVLVRPACEASAATPAQRLARLAQALLAQLHFMVPQRERALRAVEVARFVGSVLRELPAAPPGTRVAPAELLWDAARGGDLDATVRAWLHGQPLPSVALPRERW